MITVQLGSLVGVRNTSAYCAERPALGVSVDLSAVVSNGEVQFGLCDPR